MAHNLFCARMANQFLRSKGVFNVARMSYSDHGHGHGPELSMSQGREMANGREQVGHFLNGEPNYTDRYDYPYPAIRFRKDTPDILALRQKEKGDWRKLTLEEKKALYRSSFAGTFVEVEAPNGHWKVMMSLTLFVISMSFMTSYWFKHYACGPLPESMSNENKELALQHMIDLHAEPVTGVGAMWDYEKNRWKA